MQNNRPVEMKPETLKTFIAAYENMMARQIHYPQLDLKVAYRRLIYHQVRGFAVYLNDPEKIYLPFVTEK